LRDGDLEAVGSTRLSDKTLENLSHRGEAVKMMQHARKLVGEKTTEWMRRRERRGGLRGTSSKTLHENISAGRAKEYP
jgi:hypothetical protein